MNKHHELCWGVVQRSERGFTVVLMAMMITALLGMLGLALDIGRMFIVEGELQSYVDAAAMASIYYMDGTRTGIEKANSIASGGPFGTRQPVGYNFDSARVSGVTATYASDLSSTYDSFEVAMTDATNHYAFIRVSAVASVPIGFLRVIPGIPSTKMVSAKAIAGQRAVSSIDNGGLSPFMPDGHDASDHNNFGFVPGGQYTLKWGNASASSSKGKGNGGVTTVDTTCTGDVGWSDPNPTSQHGFVDLGQGNSNANLRNSVVFGGYPNPGSTPSSLSAGMGLGGVLGNRGTTLFDAMQERVNQDTDTISTTYAQYVAGGQGNGRRIITVAVADPNTWSGNGNGTAVVVGFANFFLGRSYHGTTDPMCALYVGPADLSGSAAGRRDATKIYYNVLFE